MRCGKLPSRAMVARWEPGRRIPTPYWRVHLATVLQLPAAQLDEAASVARARRGDGSESAESPSSDDRLSHVLQHPGSADLASVGYLRERVRSLDEQYDRAPSTALIPEAGQYLGQITFLGPHARSTS